MWGYMNPPSAQGQFFVDEGLEGRGENYSMNSGDGDSQSPTENDIAPGKVCICCVKIAKPQGSGTSNTPASDDPAKILRKKVFKGLRSGEQEKDKHGEFDLRDSTEFISFM